MSGGRRTGGIDPAEHLGLLWYFVNLYRRRGEPVLELASEGYVGLARAAELYDPDTGNRFSTLASWHVASRIWGWRKREYRFRTPRWSKKKVEHRRRLVLFSEFGSDYVRGNSHEFATVPPAQEHHAEVGEAGAIVRGALRQLPERDAAVVRVRYGFDDGAAKTLRETARLFGITPERIRQIEIRALRKLRDLISDRFDPQPETPPTPLDRAAETDRSGKTTAAPASKSGRTLSDALLRFWVDHSSGGSP